MRSPWICFLFCFVSMASAHTQCLFVCMYICVHIHQIVIRHNSNGEISVFFCQSVTRTFSVNLFVYAFRILDAYVCQLWGTEEPRGIHTCTCTAEWTRIYVVAYRCICTSIQYADTCIYTCIYACIYTCIYVQVYSTQIHAYIHVYMHAYIHAYIHVYMHAYIHAYIQ